MSRNEQPAMESQGQTAISPEQLLRLVECEKRIGYPFREKSLILAALTHASGANHRLASNERLEFLGDAILGAVICEFLFHRYPEYLEGDLTRIKSVVVSRRTCAAISGELGLEEFLILGKGMATHPSVPSSLMSDVFESLIAAIYLDGGYAEARRFIEQHVVPEIERVVVGDSGTNHKSQLQQLSQRHYGSTPTYRVVGEKGPDHCKIFQIAAQVGTRLFDPAWGPNKKEAEQRAARNAMLELSRELSARPEASPALEAPEPDARTGDEAS